MIDKIYIAKQIEKERISQQLTRERLAEQSGLSSLLIYQVESGKKSIGLTALIQIASALNMSLDELVYFKEKEEKEYLVHLEKIERIIKDCSRYELSVISDSVHHLKSTLRKCKN